MIPILNEIYQQLLGTVSTSHHRFLYQRIGTKERMQGIVGGRGVGKTTLMLQHILEHYPDTTKAFYISADHIYFNSNTLVEFVHELHLTEDIEAIYIDEIHKYANWNQELKNIYDSYPKLKVIFSGSSSLDIIKGSHDLSRRAILHTLPGMSLREYIEFNTEIRIKPLSLTQLIETPATLANELNQIKQLKKHYHNYLKQGYYPFYTEAPLTYYERILRIIDKTIFEDIANYYSYKTTNLTQFKKILNYLASIKPGEMNVHNIAKNMGSDDKTIMAYLESLDDTGLIHRIYPQEGGNQGLRRPDKIFLNNTNLQFALESNMGANSEIGTLRELLFLQSIINAGENVFHSKIGDYQVGDTIFEIGGKNKTRKQIKGVEKSILVKDDTLHPSAGVIPLMYFGFLY